MSIHDDKSLSVIDGFLICLAIHKPVNGWIKDGIQDICNVSIYKKLDSNHRQPVSELNVVKMILKRIHILSK